MENVSSTCKKKYAYYMFFKVYIPELSSSKLMVPTKFARKFGAELSDVVTLSVADGRSWQVGLEKTEENIFFHDGWPDFVHRYSLLHGYFLLFTYKGYSNFHVHIFDTTSCEVDRLYDGPSGDKRRVIELKEDRPKDSDVTVIPSTSKERVSHKMLREKVMKKSCSTLVTRSKKCKIEDLVEIIDLVNINRKGKDKTSKNLDGNAKDFQPLVHGSVKVDQMKHEFSVNVEDEVGAIVSHCLPKDRQNSSLDGKRALAAAKLYKTENPSFMVIVSRRNITGCDMYVPAEFVRKYLSRDLKSVTVRDSSGIREWPFHIKQKIPFGLNLTKGWSQFSRDNNLKVEDVCVFELLEMKNNVLKVSIFKTSAKSEENEVEIITSKRFSKRFTELSERGKRAVTAAKLFKPENPSLMVILGTAIFSRNAMYVSSDFASSYLRRGLKYVTIVDSAGREWALRIKGRPGCKGLDMTGMCGFLRYNTLQKDDVCVFELMKTDAIRLRVSIFRGD